ncbi:leucine-rich repeat-containing protein 31 isoform X1 [Eublepharis macularius]|uniref:Leucine-rich repeat-containing protein 31 isoform X1 n=1 Tax=Eublepharis macularius TaxID=481883 RepID=A0AA97L358_EUBMA|nr:leucine-rich repeat-containing protein 31 isoform X1 [Eublepharis macularius]XP_054840214.1 leucine-rich repeat-containing protein 31 isoform X1 [Eublepharis macularius]
MNNFRAGTQIMKQALPGAESTLCHWRVRQFLEKLDKQPNNKVLDLNNCALNASDIKELTAIIPLLPDLEEIDLSWNDFIGGALQTLTLQFSHMQELKVLRLNNCRLTAKDITFLGEALEVIPYLEVLDLSWNNNIGGSLFILTQKMPKDYNLRTLKITDCSLTIEDGKSLAQLLHRIQNLEELDLSINKNIGCSLKSIAQELKYVSGLKVLNLHMCGLKQDGFPCLDDAFQHIPELKKLDVSCNKEMGGGFQNSAAHLANLINLEVLDLHQCRITEEDMAVLTQIIPLLSSLQELDLSSNKSVGISSDNLLSRFRFLPKLKSVLLSNCSLLQNSFASLAEAALHLPELKILDLSWNKCVGGNLKLILKALNLEAELQELRLSSCSLVDKDLACLALVIQDGPLAKLQKLDLSYNNHISDQGWSTFYQGIVALEQLSELDVSLRPASRRDCGEWFGKLLAAMPKLPILSELDLQGWILSERQQKQLESCNWNNEQNVHFDT